MCFEEGVFLRCSMLWKDVFFCDGVCVFEDFFLPGVCFFFEEFFFFANVCFLEGALG